MSLSLEVSYEGTIQAQRPASVLLRVLGGVESECSGSLKGYSENFFREMACRVRVGSALINIAWILGNITILPL